jgi:acetyl esterase
LAHLSQATTKRRTGAFWLQHRASRRSAPAAAGLLAAVTILSACGSAEPAVRLEPSTDVSIQEGLTYWSDGTTDLALDACLPTAPAGPGPAIIIVHGGGFSSGDRQSGGTRALCEISANLGQAAFAIDYRLAPDHRWPAQVDDLAHAVEWLRQPAQVTRFTIDPKRIGVIGSSAGAIIAQSLATRGSGPLDVGERVAAVVSLSGVSLMSPEGLALGQPGPEAIELVLDYLGCSSATDCPQAVPASPITSVDPTDPPMMLVNGTGELVPQDQAEAMDEALRAAGIMDELMIVDAPLHGASLLTPEVRRAALSFLQAHL